MRWFLSDTRTNLLRKGFAQLGLGTERPEDMADQGGGLGISAMLRSVTIGTMSIGTRYFQCFQFLDLSHTLYHYEQVKRLSFRPNFVKFTYHVK